MIAQVFLAAFLGCLMAAAVVIALARHCLLRMFAKVQEVDPE